MVNWCNTFTLSQHSGNQYRIYTTYSGNTNYKLGVDPTGYSVSYGSDDGSGSINPVYYQRNDFGLNYELLTFELQ